MAEMEPGHPDELVRRLRGWPREAHDPTGSLPEGTDPVEWAVGRFVAAWRRPVRRAVDGIEESLKSSLAHLKAGAESDLAAAGEEIENALSLLQESLRDHLGLYDWNKDDA